MNINEMNPEARASFYKMRDMVVGGKKLIEAEKTVLAFLEKYEGNDVKLVRAIHEVTKEWSERHAKFNLAEMMVEMMGPDVEESH